MKSIKQFCMFLLLILGLISGLQASTTPLDLSDCQLIKISSEQMMVSEDKLYILDAETQDLQAVTGFIHLDGEMYAIQAISPVQSMATFCEHPRGCRNINCRGCIVHGCWNRCQCGG